MRRVIIAMLCTFERSLFFVKESPFYNPVANLYRYGTVCNNAMRKNKIGGATVRLIAPNHHSA